MGRVTTSRRGFLAAGLAYAGGALSQPAFGTWPARRRLLGSPTPSLASIGQLYADLNPGMSGATFQSGSLTTPQITDNGDVGSISDASGNGRYLGGGSSATDRPRLRLNSLNGKAAVAFDGVYDRLILQNSTSFRWHAGNFHCAVVWRPEFFRYMTPFASTGTSSDRGLYLGLKENRTLQIILCNGGTNVVDFTPTYTYTVGKWVLTEFWGSTSTGDTHGRIYHSVDGASVESKAYTAAVGNTDCTRNLNVGLATTVPIYMQDFGLLRMLLYSNALSSPSQTVLRSILSADYALPQSAAVTNRIACLGDSITQGPNAYCEQGWPTILEGLRGPTTMTGNHGVSGSLLTAMDTLWTNSITGKGFTELLLLGGVNDLLGGANAATTFSRWQTIADKAKTAGILFRCLGILPAYGYASFTAGMETDRLSVNTSISNYATTNGLTYVNPDTAMGNGGSPIELNSSYRVADKLHLNDAGCAAYATLLNGTY